MASGERKVRPGVVIKRGGNPALDVVACGASSFAFLRKLGTMDIGMTVLADLRRPFELNLAGAGGSFVACAAGNGAMGAQEWKFRFRVVETAYICP